MKINVSDQQLAILINLLDARIREIHPEIRHSHLHTMRDELKHDLEMLRQLHEDLLKEQQRETRMGGWEGYVESRQVPANPPPGG